MMPASIATAERFRAWTARQFGLHFDDDKLAFLAALVAERAANCGLVAGEYLNRLGHEGAVEERRALVTALTVPETYFFRHLQQFEAFRAVALPHALTAAGGAGKVRILCAGCASGEEPYSLAMWMHAEGIDGARLAPIRAVDLNASMLQKATAAHYSPWALRETPLPMRARWFASEGRDFVLADSIRAAVRFEQLNLADADRGWWLGNTFDVIFCRNVLMYLTREAAVNAVARLAAALAPGGYLFLGHAETLRGLSDEFELCHSHGAFYYRRGAQTAAVTGLPDVPVPDAARRDAVMHARAEALTRHVQSAWRLLAEERFSEAVNQLESISEGIEDLELRLMRAALLTHAGRLAEAERECVSLLRRDACNAGAHYLLALCRDSAHDHAAATDHDRKAMALAPCFALPALHLGLMARRAGDLEGAARHFDAARVLLPTEDNERLLLFGGGFSRAALLSLCGDPQPHTRRKAWR